MAGNTFGTLFRVTTFGESHGGCLGAVVDGCPPGLKLSESDIQPDLDRRKPGQSEITTPRKEEDQIRILSGVFEGETTGTPILIIANNKDARPEDYKELSKNYRPSHADYTYELKYGRRDWRGSGRASARETLARVAAGAIAKKYLSERFGTEFLSYVETVNNVTARVDDATVTLQQIEANIVRCPDSNSAARMIELIEKARDEGDSLGGIIRGIVRNPPAGLGEPVFDKIPADLGKAMMSINAVKGFEIGSGFSCVGMKGSQHNDSFVLDDKGHIRTETNNAGGTLGGITTGEDILFRVAIKPVATIRKKQHTVNRQKKPVILEASGRHDPCVLPRAVPIVDAMAALVIMDHYLRHRAQCGEVKK
ncbi:MAG: chorismate synthase [Candidatus Dadabacteria bacterium]|nr:MAG: chorismate synthase [Candidatus Dadabacteria bacterium]